MTETQKRLSQFIVGMAVSYIFLFITIADTRIGISITTVTLVLVASAWSAWNSRRDGTSMEKLGFIVPPWKRIVIFTMISGVTIALSATAFTTLLPEQSAALRNDVIPLPFVIFYFVISIPLQEFVFRGYILTSLTGRSLFDWQAVAASTVLYSCFHLHYGIFFMISTIPLGIIFALVRLRFKSLLFCIILHWLVGLTFYYLI